MTDSSIDALAAVGSGLVLLTLWWALRQPARPRLPNSKRAALLTPAELRFYRVLREAVPPGLTVFVKLRLMDVASVAEDAWRVYGAPGSGMHLDFAQAMACSSPGVKAKGPYTLRMVSFSSGLSRAKTSSDGRQWPRRLSSCHALDRRQVSQAERPHR